GWSLNTLRRRLAQGRRLLEARLRSRGVTLPAALAGLLAARALVVPGPLRAATLAAAHARAIGGSSIGGTALTAAWNGITNLISISGKQVGVLVVVAALGLSIYFGCRLAPHADRATAAREALPQVSIQGGGAVQDDPAANPLPARCAVRLGTARYR